MTREEIEKERLHELIMADIPDADVRPGTFYCHEALHMASFLAAAVEEQLCNHPSILSNPDWYRTSREALQKLFDLYRNIGNEHLEKK